MVAVAGPERSAISLAKAAFSAGRRPVAAAIRVMWPVPLPSFRAAWTWFPPVAWGDSYFFLTSSASRLPYRRVNSYLLFLAISAALAAVWL